MPFCSLYCQCFFFPLTQDKNSITFFYAYKTYHLHKLVWFFAMSFTALPLILLWIVFSQGNVLSKKALD